MQTNNIHIKHQMLKNSTFSQKFKQKKCKRSKRITFQNFQFPPRIHNETRRPSNEIPTLHQPKTSKLNLKKKKLNLKKIKPRN